MKIGEVLSTLASHLDQRKIRWAVGGAVGLIAWGSPRFTKDLDLVVDGAFEEELIGFLESLGYETLYRSRGFSNHLHADPDKGRVDLIYVRDATAGLLFAAPVHREAAGGLIVPVLRAEHLAAMKAAAIHDQRDRYYLDLEDVRFLVGLPVIDLDEVRGYFKRFGVEGKLDEVLARK